MCIRDRVELAASNHIIAELYYCFAMTQIACQMCIRDSAVTEWIRRIINDTQRCAEGYELSEIGRASCRERV